MQTKEEIIKAIIKYHPGYGTNLGLSWYVGGMTDTGAWYPERLAEKTTHELLVFLGSLIAKEHKVKEDFKERERISKLSQEEQDAIRKQKTQEMFKTIMRRNGDSPALQEELLRIMGINTE